MSSPPSDCTATTRRCRCWPKARRHRAMLGLCARRSAVRRHRAAGGDVLLFARSRRRASQAHLAGYAGYSRPMPMAATTSCTRPIASQGRSSRRRAGCMPAGRSSSWPMSPRMPAARRKAKRRPRSRRWRLRRSAASTRCSSIERAINGQSAEQRRAVRQELSAPLVADLERWMREQRAKLSRGNDVAKAMDYMLKRWPAFTRFLDDGRICLTNNAAERCPHCSTWPARTSRASRRCTTEPTGLK